MSLNEAKIRATPKMSLPVKHQSRQYIRPYTHQSRQRAAQFEKLNIPSPDRGPRETFWAPPAGVFLGGMAMGCEWNRDSGERPEKERENQPTFGDFGGVCPRDLLAADWLLLVTCSARLSEC